MSPTSASSIPLPIASSAFSRTRPIAFFARGLLPRREDGEGIYRFHPHEVAEVARKLGRAVSADGKTAVTIYGHFLAPGFVPTNEAIARILFATDEHPDLVRAPWDSPRWAAEHSVPLIP